MSSLANNKYILVLLILLFNITPVSAQINPFTVSFNNELVDAVEIESEHRVVQLLKSGMSPDSRGIYGVTPLMRAAHHGNLQLLNLLMSAGADVNAVDLGGATALHVASRKGHSSIITALINANAHIEFEDNAGWTPIMRASSIIKDHKIIDLMVSKGAKPTKNNKNGYNAITQAIQSSNIEVIKYYINAGFLHKLNKQEKEKIASLTNYIKDDKVKELTNNSLMAHNDKETKLAAVDHKAINTNADKNLNKTEKQYVKTNPIKKEEIKAPKMNEGLNKLASNVKPEKVAIKQDINSKINNQLSEVKNKELLPLAKDKSNDLANKTLSTIIQDKQEQQNINNKLVEGNKDQQMTSFSLGKPLYVFDFKDEYAAYQYYNNLKEYLTKNQLVAKVHRVYGDNGVIGVKISNIAKQEQYDTICSVAKKINKNCNIDLINNNQGISNQPNLAANQKVQNIAKKYKYLLQLASVRDQYKADNFIRQLQSQHRSLFNNYNFIVTTPNDNQSIYRIRLGVFSTYKSAEQKCEQLKKKNISCIIITE